MSRQLQTPDDQTLPYLSILFYDTPLLWNAYVLRSVTPEKIEKCVRAIKADGRKRVMLWARSRANAELTGTRPLLWVGRTPKGPGQLAHKIGWVSVDKLAEAIEVHMGMMQ